MDPSLELERLRQAALRRLGSELPRCVLCSEDNPRCLELHHVAGQAHDSLTVIICRNCHRKQTDPTANRTVSRAPPLMDRVGHLMLGLAIFLAELLERLRSYGTQLIAGAVVCPWPYGWIGAPGHG